MEHGQTKAVVAEKETLAEDPRCIAIIPCRGGSKRIPRKNIRIIGGVPLLAHIVRAALDAEGRIDAVYVATDDDEIARSASEVLGRSDRVIRIPPALAGDRSPVLPVLAHAWRAIVGDDDLCGSPAAATADEDDLLLCYLRATSPLVRGADIAAAVDALRAAPLADSIVAIEALTGAHPSRFKTVDAESGYLCDAFPDTFPEAAIPASSSSLTAFGRSGAVSVLRPASTIDVGSMWGARVLPLVCDEESSVDINTPFEWDVAEFLLERRRRRSAAAETSCLT